MNKRTKMLGLLLLLLGAGASLRADDTLDWQRCRQLPLELQEEISWYYLYSHPTLLYDPRNVTRRERTTLQEYTGHIESVEFSPDGSKVLSASFDGIAWILNAKTGKVLHELRRPLPNGRRFYAKFSLSGRAVVTVADGLIVEIWDVSTGMRLRNFEGLIKEESDDRIKEATLSPDES